MSITPPPIPNVTLTPSIPHSFTLHSFNIGFTHTAFFNDKILQLKTVAFQGTLFQLSGSQQHLTCVMVSCPPTLQLISATQEKRARSCARASEVDARIRAGDGKGMGGYNYKDF